MIENIIKEYSDGEIVVLNNVKIELQEELMQDMLQIMNVFVAKMFSYINKP
jgi:predicted site-specific integrase-resolvase